MPKAEMRVSQKDLAAALGVTTRRVRQMETEFILPPPRDGTYDLGLCRERYQLYRTGTDRDWQAFYGEAEDAGRRTKRLMDAVEAPDATDADVRAASLAIQDLFATARFITACRSTTDAERAFIMPLWTQQENGALRVVMSRMFEIIAEREGVTPEEVCARIGAEGEAAEASEKAA